MEWTEDPKAKEMMKELLEKKYSRLRRSLGRIRDFQIETSRLNSSLFDGTQLIDQDGTYEYVIVDNTDMEGIVKGKSAPTQAQVPTADDNGGTARALPPPQISRERTESILLKKPTKRAGKTPSKKETTKKTPTVSLEKGKYQSE